jgi:hypothetical protein
MWANSSLGGAVGHLTRKCGLSIDKLNEFLKEHRKVEEQGRTIAKQEKQIEALMAQMEKVSALVETMAPARSLQLPR